MTHARQRSGDGVTRLGGPVIVAALLAAIVALQHTLPDSDRQYRPIAAEGTVGEVVRTPDFRIEVDKVEVARAIAERGSSEGPVTTQGIWVIVWARAAGEREPTRFVTPLGVQLVTRGGHGYAAHPLSGLAATGLEPGLWQYGPLVFELPPARLAGAELFVTTEHQRSLNSQAHIPLGVDAAEARRLVENAPARLVVEGARYV